jgi:hypothetical protein
VTDDLQRALAEIVAYLEREGIAYMLVGSVAALAHGRSRSTRAFDLVIEARRDQLLRFVHALPDERYYVSETATLEALAHGSPFNVLDLDTGWKIDLMIRKQRDFSRAEFARREKTRLLGGGFHVATIEDTILAKLEWARLGGGSARQLEDVRELVGLAGARLDRDHIERWVDALDVRA